MFFYVSTFDGLETMCINLLLPINIYYMLSSTFTFVAVEVAPSWRLQDQRLGFPVLVDVFSNPWRILPEEIG